MTFRGAPWWTTPECSLLNDWYEIAARSDDDVDRLLDLLFALPRAGSVVAAGDRRRGRLFDQYSSAYDLYAASVGRLVASTDCDGRGDCNDSGFIESRGSIDHGEHCQCD